MLKKVTYYKFSDFISYDPTEKRDFYYITKDILGIVDLEDLLLPEELDLSLASELLSKVLQRYHNNAIVKQVTCINEEPLEEEKQYLFKEWYVKFITLLNETYDYYATILVEYKNAKSELMADIKATSKNKVKFNDTPQNPNGSSGAYEGDDYITHFTSTEGENSSPLMSKMMRLKEIQENYRDIMSRWVNDFRRIFYEEEIGYEK